MSADMNWTVNNARTWNNKLLNVQRHKESKYVFFDVEIMLSVLRVYVQKPI